MERSILRPRATGSIDAVHQSDGTEQISARKVVRIAEEATVLGERYSIHRHASMDDEWTPIVGTPTAVFDVLTAVGQSGLEYLAVRALEASYLAPLENTHHVDHL